MNCCFARRVRLAPTMDAVSFVKSLELPTDPFTATEFKTTDKKGTGCVAAGSILSFTSALKGQQKSDVLNSTLLAQLAANKKYDRYKETEQWYKFYVNVLENVGWVVQAFQFDRFVSDAEDFKISDVVLDLLAAMIGGDAVLMGVVKASLEALKKTADGITLFGSNSSTPENGAFQIVPCTVGKNNQVSVAFIGCYFTAKQVVNNYFFVTWKKQDIKLFKSTESVTLDETVYSQVRDEILKKLGNKAVSFVKDLPIA